MFHQRSNSLLFVGLLFWFPVMNGQNNLRRVRHSETRNVLLIAADDTGKEGVASGQYTNSIQKKWPAIYLNRYCLHGKTVLNVMSSKIAKGVIKDLKHLPKALNS